MSDEPLREPRCRPRPSRRSLLTAGLAVAASAASTRVACAESAAAGREGSSAWSGAVAGGPAGPRMPVLFLSHGSPRLPIDPVRSGELRAWGATLPKPRGILVMTPHFGSRKLAFGPTGPGHGMYDMPERMRQMLPQDLDYPSPPSHTLAARVERLLSEEGPVEHIERRGFDHTTWMPLSYLYPAADAPVLELAYPYRSEPEMFALGRRLAPLRDEGIVVVASGQMTHNLAFVRLTGSDPPPGWSREFDAWAAEALASHDLDALIDWRHKAPAADLAHPDDGGHFRVLVLALGVLAGRGGSLGEVRFPVQGFESTMSKRAAQMG